MAGDGFSDRYGELLTGGYDCVDRVVLNAYYPLGHSPGGFRYWWRLLHGDDAQLDDTHLMRMAGRFARRVRAFAAAHDVPVIDCGRGERKHRIAEDYLATHTVAPGLFLILVAKAPASVWQVERTRSGVVRNLAKRTAFVNHYSFHLMDPDWGHLVIKMSGHPPFAAQVILNGHEYVACQAQRVGVCYTKEGTCFTRVPDPDGLAQLADTLSSPQAVGRLGQVIDRWIYTACLCFGLDLADVDRTGFRYAYSVYQVEYSRNLIFRSGAQMDRVFNAVLDRTRSRLDIATLRTMFGAKHRPHTGGEPSMAVAAVIERPRYDLTIFKVHFGLLTLKAYTKGEHVLRFEAITHNTKALGCGRILDKFPVIVAALAGMLERFATVLDCVDTGFVPDALLDDLPTPTTLGRTRIGGVDLDSPRTRAALAAVLALSPADPFAVADLAAKVHGMTGQAYTTRQAAYDLRQFRGKNLVVKPGRGRRYHLPPDAARTISALLALREHVIAPILAGVRSPRRGRKPSAWTRIDRDYETLRHDMQTLFDHLGIPNDVQAA